MSVVEMKGEQILFVAILAAIGFLGWQTFQELTGQQTMLSSLHLSDPLTTVEPSAFSPKAVTNEPPAEAAALALTYTGETLRDPFTSVLPEEVAEEAAVADGDVALPTLRLQGLMYGGLKPRAIIEGKVVAEGQQVGDVEVLQITPDGVLLSHHGKRFFLKKSSALQQRKPEGSP